MHSKYNVNQIFCLLLGGNTVNSVLNVIPTSKKKEKKFKNLCQLLSNEHIKQWVSLGRAYSLHSSENYDPETSIISSRAVST